jgi:hypothetical protein
MSGATLGRPLVSLFALSAFNQTFASHREAFDPRFLRIHLGLDPTEVRERPALLGHARRRIFFLGPAVSQLPDVGAVELHIDFRMLG